MTDRNANRPGYKKTPVGWIPEEWECHALGDLVSVKHGFAFQSDLFTDHGRFVVLTPGNFNEDGGFRTRGELDRYYAGAFPDQYILREGQMLVAMTEQKPGLLGSALIVPKEARYLHNQRLGLVVSKDKTGTCDRFIYWSFNSRPLRRQVSETAAGTKVRHTSPGRLCAVLLPLPPLPEQKKIADILSTWDEAIEQTRALLDAAKRRKKALMQQLLTGKKRLPGFGPRGGRRAVAASGAADSAPTARRPPEGCTQHRFFALPSDWGFPRLAEVAAESVLRNTARQSLTVLSCSKHRGFVASGEYFGKQIHSEDTSNYKVIRRGWFGFPSNHVEEGSIGLLATHDAGLLSPIYIVFRTDDQVLPEYLFAVFKTETYRHIFEVSTSASVDRRGSLRWDDFSAIRVPLPSLPEQRAIADVLTSADDEIKSLEAKAAALERQKKGLMQKLLTGEVRVKGTRDA